MDIKKTPHTPQKMNIFGRKRYSVHTSATDHIDYSFDDCWQAIGKLWAAVVMLGIAVIWVIFQGKFEKDSRIKNKTG